MTDRAISGKSVSPLFKKKSHLQEFVAQFDLQILVIPSIIHIFVFAYIPMYGILMAFQEFQLGDFPGLSEWVGFKQFGLLFHDPNFTRVLRNTVVIAALKLVINFPIPILFAIMLNELTGRRFKRSVQTISYLPHFISWVVGATLLFDFFSVDNGAVNTALLGLGFVDRPIHFFGEGKLFWGMLVGTDLWKEVGWNSIIYIAAITSIDSEMYEAADIDGAGRYAKMWHITIATIRPTIVLLFIFTVGGLLNANFDQIMLLTNQMQNAQLREFADVIDTYVYRVGIRDTRFSYAAAAGLFKAIVNFGLLLGANKFASKFGEEAF
jgi:putative aldouronate transport system permease protein